MSDNHLHAWIDGHRVFVGPEYTITSPTLQKYRRAARKGGLSGLSRDERDAYALAIETAVRAAQRNSLRREKPEVPCSCASGTAHNTGEAIHKAILAQQRASLLACKSRIATMEPDKVRELYEQAMEEKRARAAQEEECRKAPVKSPTKRTAKPAQPTTVERRATAGTNSTRSRAGRGNATRSRATGRNGNAGAIAR